MKLEFKKITVEKEVYISEDGMEFDTYDECENHELNMIAERLNMYDSKFNKCLQAEDAYYVKLDKQEDVEAFVRLANYDGVSSSGITYPGIYTYVENTYGRGKVAWLNLLETVNKIEEAANDSCS